MTTKHTPGPWVVGNVGEVKAGGITLADVYGDEEQADVDAYLIAAAPDLLAALEACEESISANLNPHHTAAVAARDAVAKARG